MSIEEAIKILDYKINMYKEDVFIGDLDKTNIEAIKKVLKEIERLNNIINKGIEELDKYINYCLIDGESYDVCNHALKCMIKARDILKGEDNE